MSVTADAAAKRAQARELFEQQAMSLRDIGRTIGVSRETVRRWSSDPSDPWTKPMVARGADGQRRTVPTTEEVEQARLRAEKARQEARTRWATRRSEEADAAGITAAATRQKLLEYVNQGKPSEARQLATVYGILVDKAMLMSGEGVVGGSRGRQGDEEPAGPRPTDPREMAEAGKARVLSLVPKAAGAEQ